MKYITLLFALAITLTSCDSNDDFVDTDTIAQSFEVTLDFDAPNYEATINTPNTIDIFENDMTLVYLLQDEQPDAWVLLPQIFYAANFEYQYNFQATSTSTTIFLDSPNFNDLDFLSNQEVFGKTFRIVRIPVGLFNSGIDINDMEAVMGALETSTENISTQ